MILKIKFTTRQVNSSSRGLNQRPFSRKKLCGHAANQILKYSYICGMMEQIPVQNLVHNVSFSASLFLGF